jgi:hypothetical protein
MSVRKPSRASSANRSMVLLLQSFGTGKLQRS